MASVREKSDVEALSLGGPGYGVDPGVSRYVGPNHAGRGRFVDKMALAVASLSRGSSVQEAACHAGVSVRTVHRWRHRPEFVAALDRWRRDRALVVDTLRAILEDPEVHSRLKLRAASRLALIVKDRQAASNRVEDLIARDERIVNAVMLAQPTMGVPRGRQGD